MEQPTASAGFEEWRVTGEPGHGFPTYEFIFSPERNPHLGDPETAAREFFAEHPAHGSEAYQWDDGPHLSRRTVSAWEYVE